MSQQAAFLQSRLSHLFDNKRHVDFVIATPSVRIPCHKSVVAIFSPRVAEECRSKDCEEISVEHDPSLLLSLLYNWKDVSYLDYINNIVLSAHELQAEFLLQGQKSKKSQFNGDDHMRKLKQLHTTTFKEGLKRLRRSQAFVDVTLEVQGYFFKCHKVILCAASDYFDIMFSSGMLEEGNDNICLQGVDHVIMDLILEYIYTEKLDINVTNADIMISTAVYFQMPSLQDLCEMFLSDNLDVENCCDVIQLAELYSCNNLKENTTRYLLSHFKEVTTRAETKFTKLPGDVLEALIESDDLLAPDEASILNAVLSWFDVQKDQEEHTLLSLLKHVRLNLIPSHELQRYLNENKHIKRFPECKKLVLHSSMDTTSKTNHSTKQRREEVLLVLKGSGYLKGLSLACFTFQPCCWYRLPELGSYTPGCSYAACADDSNIYVSGGTNSPRSFYRFSLDRNQWMQLKSMSKSRSEHGMVVIKDAVYCIGGTMQPKPSFTSIDKYQNDTWTKVGDLSVQTANAGCSCHGQIILIFGGTKSVGVLNHEIQAFNTVTNQCTIISHFPKKIMSGLLGLASDSGKYYLTTANGIIVRYIVGGGEPETIGTAHNLYLLGFATVIHKDDLYILGGTSLKSEEECTRQFNLKSRASSVNRSMKLPFERASNQYFSAIVRISRSFLNQSFQ
ncbi:hypothetical protein FSP39_001273 [Pinctada imbricata]|uniref:BTB domain-containing protein n=1 Tax=Pinctada imbricata TaxID=66713 RepID=A0AA88XP59_PINIB|nr:hypothetical protein FSP39_001273 [Pinctada imbricata]